MVFLIVSCNTSATSWLTFHVGHHYCHTQGSMFTHLHGPSYPTHICKPLTRTKSHPLTHLRPCRRNACRLLLNVTVLCSHSDMHLCIHSKLIKGRHEQDIECHSLNIHLSPKQCWMCSSLSSSPLPDTPSLQALCPVSPSGSKPASSE